MNYEDISTGSTECVCTKYNIFAILMTEMLI
jgi:hypothetical protein